MVVRSGTIVTGSPVDPLVIRGPKGDKGDPGTGVAELEPRIDAVEASAAAAANTATSAAQTAGTAATAAQAAAVAADAAADTATTVAAAATAAATTTAQQVVAAAVAGMASLGQTSIDVAAAGGNLTTAMAVHGPGKRYNLNGYSYTEHNHDVVLGSTTNLQGVSSSLTTLVLSGSSRIVTDGYDNLVGTNPATGHGPNRFGIFDLAVEGGGGVRIYGSAYRIRHVVIRGSAVRGFETHWTNADNPIPAEESMEAEVIDLKVHHCATGPLINGPHDSRFIDLESWFNSGGDGLTVGPSGNGIHLINPHIYGLEHEHALVLDAHGVQALGVQAEGASVAQLVVTKAGSRVTGRIFSAPVAEDVIGCVLGRPGNLCAAVDLDLTIENCDAGAFDFTHFGGIGVIDAVINAGVGAKLHPDLRSDNGEPQVLPTLASMRVSMGGGMTYQGSSEPLLTGPHHFTHDIATRGRLIGLNGRYSVEAAGVGMVQVMASVADGQVANPGTGKVALFIDEGSTAGTYSINAIGPNGTAVALFDNIPK